MLTLCGTEIISVTTAITMRAITPRVRNGKRRTTINLILAVSSFIVCATPEVIVSAISRFHGTTDLLQGISEMTNFILLEKQNDIF
jgi:flavin reductase (DIM6/NTAB) family NADH-FMN oxidoreductase RutF